MPAQFNVAIVGGGIVGLVTAIGLQKRGIPIKIYEQSSMFRELGAGVAFTANAMKCMELLDPGIVDAVNAVATPNGEDMNNPNDYMRYHDGYHYDPTDPSNTDDKLLGLLFSGYKGFQGCHRAHLLDKLVKMVPESVVDLGHRFVGFEDRGPDKKLLLRFQDGTTAEADAIIGCDGIKSKVRQAILGVSNPASYPQFSHKVAYRALVPMNLVIPVLGTFKALNMHLHTGPRAHVLHFPVVNQTLLNVVIFVTQEEDWPLVDEEHASVLRSMTADGSRAELDAVFESWGPTVRSLVGLLPDKMVKWAIFDLHDRPLPTYVCGRVVLAGDAAHASSPHHGGGAGVGVEDALALSKLFEIVCESIKLDHDQDINQSRLNALLEAAFNAYDKVRPPRSQWLVKSSREACEIYEWAYPDTKDDWAKCMVEIERRSHKLWYFDIEGMLSELEMEYRKQLTRG
ncbi:hypothetical protein BD289DRAFT_372568 [Coniella lustricola]|uniref:FAD-binding domain-containing protein n=1 Tax=Coniella lustricola TaxID=2025994 RepID=A0A2T3A289_9PEZI|nr:hypothetical protein BD289DRAFT_372568 [Coniella lustricola]